MWRTCELREQTRRAFFVGEQSFPAKLRPVWYNHVVTESWSHMRVSGTKGLLPYSSVWYKYAMSQCRSLSMQLGSTIGSCRWSHWPKIWFHQMLWHLMVAFYGDSEIEKNYCLISQCISLYIEFAGLGMYIPHCSHATTSGLHLGHCDLDYIYISVCRQSAFQSGT